MSAGNAARTLHTFLLAEFTERACVQTVGRCGARTALARRHAQRVRRHGPRVAQERSQTHSSVSCVVVSACCSSSFLRAFSRSGVADRVAHKLSSERAVESRRTRRRRQAAAASGGGDAGRATAPSTVALPPSSAVVAAVAATAGESPARRRIKRVRVLVFGGCACLSLFLLCYRPEFTARWHCRCTAAAAAVWFVV